MGTIKIRCSTAEIQIAVSAKNAAQTTAEIVHVLLANEQIEASDAHKVLQILSRSFGMNVTTSSVQLTFHN